MTTLPELIKLIADIHLGEHARSLRSGKEQSISATGMKFIEIATKISDDLDSNLSQEQIEQELIKVGIDPERLKGHL